MYTTYLIPAFKGSSGFEGHLKMGSRGQQQKKPVYFVGKVVAYSQCPVPVCLVLPAELVGTMVSVRVQGACNCSPLLFGKC